MALRLVKVDHKLVHSQKMVIKRYPIPFPKEIVLGGSVSSDSKEVGVDVVWDERKTIINQALLTAFIHGRNDGWPFAPRAFEARFYVNDYIVAARGWGAVASCLTQTVDTNIGAYLLNGRNRFKLEIVASWGPFSVGADAITADLEVWFTGKEPTVKPTPPEWVKYVMWGAIGFGAIAFLGFVVVPLIKRRS